MDNTEHINSTIGELLRKYRRRSKRGIKSVAASLDITHGYLSKIENNKKIPSRGLIIRLCNLFQCSSEDTNEILAINDTLLAETGSLPSDIKDIVKTHGDEIFSLIRNTYGENNGR